MTTVRRPLIVHFPIQSKNIPMNDMPIMYDPQPPNEAQPYGSFADNPFMEESERMDGQGGEEVTVSEKSTTIRAAVQPQSQSQPQPLAKEESAAQPTCTDYYNMKGTFLVQYKETQEVKTIPQTSDAACFWCCHTFTTRPVVLPIRDTGEYLIVTGNFCSPECAMAHLFDIHQDTHTRWEQLALLYRVYGDICHGKIYPAPARTVLTLFGGTLTIEQYRGLIASHTVRVDIHIPPMVSILATMDTKPIDFYDSSLTKNVTETVKERLQKAEEVLRLKRTKPLKAWESTLDACINLKIKYDSS